MSIFAELKALRAVQRKLLPSLQTATDIDIVLAIGCAQEAGQLSGTKGLFTSGIGPRATISRRLDRLKKLGIIKQRTTDDDARRRNLVLNESFCRSVARLARAYKRILVR